MAQEHRTSDQVERGSDDEGVLISVAEMLDLRSRKMKKALQENSKELLKDDKHLDEGTPEQAYWHAGYVAAMQDALRLLKSREGEWPLTMTPSQPRLIIVITVEA